MNKLWIIAACVVLASCGSETETKKENPYSTAAKEPSKGGRVFNSSCIQCHGLDEDKVGPKLRGALANWDNDTARISAFIRNAGATIVSGDPRAVKVAADWNNALMTPMPHLTDEDINALLEYIAE